MRPWYHENKLRLEVGVKYKEQHRSACTTVPRGAAVTFSFGIIATAVAQAFEKLAGSLPCVLESAPAFFPCDVAATKRRTETINGIENSRNTPFTFVLLSRLFSCRSRSSLSLYFSQMRENSRARERIKWHKVSEK